MGSGIERMIELFVAHGGDCNIPNSDGLTVLHINCSCGGGLIDIFIKNGANVNALDNEGQPPVMYALIYRNESVFEASFPVTCSWCAMLMLTFVCRNCGSAGQTSI